MSYKYIEIQKTKERLGDLRVRKELTRKELSSEIERTQGIYISGPTLGIYEDDPDQILDSSNHCDKYERTQNMSVSKMVAIADYYNVPVEYLLGRSNIKDTENDELISSLNLSDKAINNIKSLLQQDKTNQGKLLYHSRIDMLNTFLESDDFVKIINYLAESRLYWPGQHSNEISQEDFEGTFKSRALYHFTKLLSKIKTEIVLIMPKDRPAPSSQYIETTSRTFRNRKQSKTN